MRPFRPDGTLEIGGGGGGLASLDPLSGGPLTLAQAACTGVVVDLGVGRDHDRADIALGPRSRMASTPVGSEITVALGNAEEPTAVLTGEVTATRTSASGTLLSVVASTQHLAATRVDLSWQGTTVATIVRDLLDAADVDAGTVDATTTYPAYHVDARRDVWRHLHDLALRTGSQVTTEPDGAIAFGPAPGLPAGGGLGGALSAAAGAVAGAVGLGQASSLRIGADVVSHRLGDRVVAPPATVLPLGAASLTGPDDWGVPRGEGADRSGTAIVDPALRDQAGADLATAARAAAASRAARTGTVTAVGNPGVRAGAVVGLADDDWRVLRVHHELTARGFLTRLELEGAS